MTTRPALLSRLKERASRIGAWLDRLPPLLSIRIEITTRRDD